MNPDCAAVEGKELHVVKSKVRSGVRSGHPPEVDRSHRAAKWKKEVAIEERRYNLPVCGKHVFILL